MELLSYDKILGRLVLARHIKKEFNYKTTNKDIAKALNMKPNLVSTHKMRCVIPYKYIIDICIKYNIDMNYIFTGVRK